MRRIGHTLATALTVFAGLLVAGAALQLGMIALPYLLILLLAADSPERIDVLVSGVWLVEALALFALAFAAMRIGSRLRIDRWGAGLGVAIYPALTLLLALVPAPASSPLSAIAFTHSFVAVPVTVAIVVAWLAVRGSARRAERRLEAALSVPEPACAEVPLAPR